MSESFLIIFAWETTGEKYTFYSQNKGKNVLWWDIQNSFYKNDPGFIKCSDFCYWNTINKCISNLISKQFFFYKKKKKISVFKCSLTFFFFKSVALTSDVSSWAFFNHLYVGLGFPMDLHSHCRLASIAMWASFSVWTQCRCSTSVKNTNKYEYVTLWYMNMNKMSTFYCRYI